MKRQERQREIQERNAKIHTLHQQGIKAEFIAARFGLRTATVYSIVSKQVSA